MTCFVIYFIKLCGNLQFTIFVSISLSGSVDISMANMIYRSVRMAQIQKFVLFYQQYNSKLDLRSGVYVYL